MPSVPPPSEVKPWYLRNITEALALNEETGNVYLRTGSGGVGEISFPATQIDAFGRLRVSNPVTVFDAQNRYVDGEQFSSDNSGVAVSPTTPTAVTSH